MKKELEEKYICSLLCLSQNGESLSTKKDAGKFFYIKVCKFYVKKCITNT